MEGLFTWESKHPEIYSCYNMATEDSQKITLFSKNVYERDYWIRHEFLMRKLDEVKSQFEQYNSVLNDKFGSIRSATNNYAKKKLLEHVVEERTIQYKEEMEKLQSEIDKLGHPYDINDLFKLKL